MTRIVAFPKSGIAYNDALYREVEKLGVEVVDGIFAGGWLWQNLRPGDWVHLHWPSFDYASRRGKLAQLRAFARWLALLMTIRARRARIVWTAHNLLPHDRSPIACLDALARHVVIALSRRIMVHGKHAAEALVERFPTAKRKISLLPHGNWIDHYPGILDRGKARAKLGLRADRFVYLFIGLCKPYKNVDGLVRVFRDLPGDGILVIAGQFQDEEYLETVSDLASRDDRIRIHSGFVPDDLIHAYLAACDIVVAPYREVLTSGTAMLAMSFGRPLISVSLGFLRDVVPPCAGILFPPGDADGLRRALEAAPHHHFANGSILAHARRFRFDDAARRLIDAIDGPPVRSGKPLEVALKR